MNVVDNRTTRKDNNKYQTTSLIYDQNSMAIITKIIKSNSHQIKLKRNNLTYNSIEKIGDVSSMQLLTGQAKEQRGGKFKNTFPFLKTINFTVIKVIRCQLKSLNVHLYLHRNQLRHVIVQ